MTKTLTLLGIESSCDETAAAVVRGTPNGPGHILSNEVFAQESLHLPYGGVVPELAARAHAEKLDHVIEDALAAADHALTDLDAIAVTAGPGLIGGVLSGVMTAKALAAATGLPLIGVNHLAGHALTPRLTEGLAYPYLMLLVSGGHCQFLAVDGPDQYRRLGGTIDDAPGEAFDKSARLLSLGYPGGPAMERAAMKGDPNRFALPRPLMDRAGCDMSFSGLKTALRRQRDLLMTDNTLKAQDQADLAASFQKAVADVLAEKTRRALTQMEDSPIRLAVAGGVAANQTIRAALQATAEAAGATLSTPPLALCTDNAAMIAWAGLERFAAGDCDDMSLSARPRWPLDQSAAPLLGSGKKGAKA